jgi:hypothetical protein
MSFKNILYEIVLGKLPWRSLPPEALGRDFYKFIAAHAQGGFAAVERLLAGVSISRVMQANAYTALARHLKYGDCAEAAEAARRAYELDPKAYRLKWLLFRLCEAGNVIEAKALLDILPPDTSFSESEARRANQLRIEAAKILKAKTKKSSGDGFNNRHLKTLGKIRLAPALKNKVSGMDAEALDHNAARNPKVSSAPKYIVTLTSYGKRLTKTAPYAIASLLAQMEQPDRIILWVAHAEGGRIFDASAGITAIYAELIAKGVEIRYCEDMKSYKKLIPALREFPGDILITADDDCLYPFDWFAKLKASYLAAPEKIHCHRAREIVVDVEYFPMAYRSWRKKISSEGFTPMPNGAVIFPIGAGGILYPPYSLDARVLHGVRTGGLLERDTDKISALTICPTADNVWFWAMAKLAEREYVLVPDGYRKDEVIDAKISKQRCANDKQYDEQLAAVLMEFPELKEKVFFKIMPSILPPEFARQELRLRGKALRGEKIRVLFVFNEPAFWSADELYRIFSEDVRFEPLVVVAPEFKYVNVVPKSDFERQLTIDLDYCRRHNYRFISGYAADGETALNVGAEFQPDIVVYSRPYPQNLHPYFRQQYLSAALSCYIPYGPMTWDSSNPAVYNNVFNSPFHKRLWKFFVTNLAIKETLVQLSANIGNNDSFYSMVATGYPKFDDLQATPISGIDPWKNIKDGKKRVIWAPHHTVGTGGKNGARYDGNGCFHLIYETMLALAKKYCDKVQFAFKPHPALPSRLKLYLNWTDDQIVDYYRQWETLYAQVETGDYIDLFLTSDALIHDCISFQLDYLCTGKPQLFLERPGQSKAGRWNDFGNAIYDLNYKTQDIPLGIEDFIEKVVLADDDPMKVRRKKYITNNLRSPFGKTASQNMFDAIVRGLGLSDERFSNNEAGHAVFLERMKYDATYSAYWQWNSIPETEQIGLTPQTKTDVLYRALDAEAAAHFSTILAKNKSINTDDIASIFSIYSPEELRILANYRGFLRDPMQLKWRIS